MAQLKERHPEVQLEKKDSSAGLKPRNKVSSILPYFMVHSREISWLTSVLPGTTSYLHPSPRPGLASRQPARS
jgi:hypothetical protein